MITKEDETKKDFRNTVCNSFNKKTIKSTSSSKLKKSKKKFQTFFSPRDFRIQNKRGTKNSYLKDIFQNSKLLKTLKKFDFKISQEKKKCEKNPQFSHIKIRSRFLKFRK